MKSETALPGLAEPTEVSLKPAAGREAPVVWVQALAVHSEWPAQAGTLLREIRLRRGLNILWAEPALAGTKNRTSGHATGKTTFCRLLRYILDDADSGTKDFRQRFQKKFPRGGWVFGEVIIAGEQWLVGRPLSPGFHPFALKGGSLADAKGEKPLRGAYEDYQNALDAAAFQNVTLRHLSATNRRLTWDCLLEWLARDQEARFAGLLEWRHTDSDYESPMLIAADKENLVRIVLRDTVPQRKMSRRSSQDLLPQVGLERSNVTIGQNLKQRSWRFQAHRRTKGLHSLECTGQEM